MEKQRIDWVDYAKGICIVAVVTFYVTTHVEHAMGRHGWMNYIVAFAQPFRMPDFFLLSGLFVASVLRRPLLPYIDSKVLHFLYFYIVWITLRMLLQDGSKLMGTEAATVLREYAALYIQPHGQLWFIYLLPAFFIAVRLVRRVPPALVFVLAVALKLAELNTGYKMIDRFGMYFVYFHAGYLFAPRIFAAAAWVRDHKTLAAAFLTAWFGLNAFMVAMHWTYLPGMQLLLGFAGAGAVLLGSSLLSQVHWMDWLRYLGKNSLVVYLAFVVPMAAMRKLLAAFPILSDPGTVSLLVIVGSIGGALVLHRVAVRTPLRFLFIRPAWLRLSARGTRPAQEVSVAAHR